MPNLDILNAPLRRSQIWGRSASGIGDMRSAERRSASEAVLLFPVWKKREVGGGVSAMASQAALEKLCGIQAFIWSAIMVVEAADDTVAGSLNGTDMR